MESTKLFNHLKKYGVARTNQFKVNIGLGESLLNKLNGEPAGGGGGSLLSELSNAAGSVFGGVNSTISKAIQVGAVLLGGSSKVARSLSLVCEATALPGVNVSTQEIRMTGAIRKQPYGSLHDDIQFIFLCSGDMLEKKAFDLWIDEVVDKETK
ncbi:MAG: hypothetical protein KAS32_23060, partial [Candidatus Peribacteraceae bacterium]|nr:hypothetical protein [Candidatus Peribacteraceae bacterium]